jgi:Icc-related predicted phosphoesterase
LSDGTAPPPGFVRIAAVGDLHCGRDTVGLYRARFARLNEEADALVLCGDLTRTGRLDQAEALANELAPVKVPIVAVLGNHDLESGLERKLEDLLRARGVRVLDGRAVEISPQLGFAGVRGYGGGFGSRTISAFGEPATKRFVEEAVRETLKLEIALRELRTPIKIAVTHYAPIEDTCDGEPREIFAFLGTSRLASPIDAFGATMCVHGHCHRGSLEGRTRGGVPVYNVAFALLQSEMGPDAYYRVFTLPVPEVRSADPRAASREPASAPRAPPVA